MLLGFIASVSVACSEPVAAPDEESADPDWSGCAEPADAVVARICREVPRLKEAGATDTERTTWIREWAYDHIDVAGSDGSFSNPRYYEVPTAVQLERFARDETAVYCGGAAWILVELYLAFGFDAWTYNHGFEPSSATHVVTIVRADGKLLVQDAYLDHLLADDRGRPIDLLEALRRLAAGDEGAVAPAHSRVVPERDVLVDEPTLEEQVGGGVEAFGVWDLSPSTCDEVAAGLLRCRAATSADNLADWDTLKELPSYGLPASAELLMLLPLGVSNPADGWTTPSDVGRDTPAAHLMADILAALD